MALRTEPFSVAVKHWKGGCCVLAQADTHGVWLFQACSLQEARQAAQHRRLPVHNQARVTWLTPAFLSCAHTNEWGAKSGHEGTLAVCVTRPFFEALVGEGVPPSWDKARHPTKAQWKDALKNAEVRLSWNYDREPSGEKHPSRRALYLGLKGNTLQQLASGDKLLRVEDISGVVEAQRAHIGDANALLVPVLRPLQLGPDAKSIARPAERKEGNALEELEGWAVVDAAGSRCHVVDIGANLTKLSQGALIAQLERCKAAGVTRVVITGTSVKASVAAARVCRQHKESADARVAGVGLFFTAGVHPHDAKTFGAGTIRTLEGLLRDPLCVAVGECGLDYDRMFSARDQQLWCFEEQVKLALKHDRALFIHERDVDAHKGAALGSHSDLVGVLGRLGVRPGRVCVHCFTGTAEHLADYVAKGYFVGLTGFVAMRGRGKHVREALGAGALPLSQLMLETDAPFMKPDKQYLPHAFAQSRCEPCMVPAVCRAVAECVGVDAARVARATTQNACAFFGLV